MGLVHFVLGGVCRDFPFLCRDRVLFMLVQEISFVVNH